MASPANEEPEIEGLNDWIPAGVEQRPVDGHMGAGTKYDHKM